MKVYLDNAATTKVDENVLNAMLPYFSEEYGNPSSSHNLGQEARRVLEEAREKVAKKIGANYKEVIFTGSGTEANNFALKGLFFSNYPKKNHIITTKIEHDCIMKTCKWLETQDAKVTYLDVDKQGYINLEQLEKSINPQTIVVSIIHGNNEVGTIQNLSEIGKICKKKGVLFHSDACQSFTKVPINVKKQNIDLMTINSHKIHGPKGVGALYIKTGIKITPLLHGGGHEFGLRSSTENTAGIVGFSKAINSIGFFDLRKIKKTREYFLKRVKEISNIKINGDTEKGLPNIINVCFMDIEAEALGSYLNGFGVYSSVGSACSSHSHEPSHVLKAMGKTNLEINSSVRFSISKYTTKEEIDYAIENLKKVVSKLRAMSPLSK